MSNLNQNELKKYEEKLKKIVGVRLVGLSKAYIDIVKKVHDCCEKVRDYYYDVIYKKYHLIPPETLFGVLIRIKIRNVSISSAWTEALCPFINIPYATIEKNSERGYSNFIITLCHEMLHVVQRNSYSRYRCNAKWDEAIAQYFEDEAPAAPSFCPPFFGLLYRQNRERALPSSAYGAQ